MAFSNVFGGYFVIHSETLNPERAEKFTSELKRVGIEKFKLICPLEISEYDPRLKHFGVGGHKLLSLIDCFQRAVEIARKNSLHSIVIFEDDIKFRKGFDAYWAELEPLLEQCDWDIIALHRTKTDSSGVIIENLFRKIEFVQIKHNTLTHCVVLRASAYDKFYEALEYCIHMGYPADFFYGVFTYDGLGKIFATTKNITGQSGGFASGLQDGRVRLSYFSSEFQCYRNRIEWYCISVLRALLSTLRNFSKKRPL